MKNLAYIAALPLSVAFAPACSDATDPPTEPPVAPPKECEDVPSALSSEMTERIDQLVADRMQRGRVPGLALAIVRDGKQVYLRGYGTRNLRTNEPMTGCTRASIGSTTKSMTAFAVMQLVEQGRVDLEAPVTTYIPWFQTADGQGGNVLVNQVLSHTAGLPTSSLLEGDLDEGALERRVRSISSVKLSYPPGQGWNYANYGYAIAGLIVQTVSGLPYEEYMKRHLFEPLKMVDTSFGAPGAGPTPLVQGYVWTRGELRPAPLLLARGQYPSGAATYSSARDASLYLTALLAEGHAGILSDASADRLWRPVAPATPTSSYAFGWETGALYGRQAAFHGGNVVGSASFFVLFPDDKVAIATVANLNSPTQEAIARGVGALLFGAEPPPATPLTSRPPSTFAPDPSAWQAYVGEYASPVFGAMTIYEESGRLLAKAHYVAPPLVLEFEAYGDNDFVIRHELGQLEGVQVSFQANPDGKTYLVANGQPAAVKQ